MAPNDVRHVIRHRIERGYLPRQHTTELWQGGARFGRACDGCGATIATNEPLFLLCGENWSLIRIHLACYHIWNYEKADEVAIVERDRVAEQAVAGEPLAIARHFPERAERTVRPKKE